MRRLHGKNKKIPLVAVVSNAFPQLLRLEQMKFYGTEALLLLDSFAVSEVISADLSRCLYLSANYMTKKITVATGVFLCCLVS